jgi:hypothetical protein
VYIKNQAAGAVDTLLCQQYLELHTVALKLQAVVGGYIADTTCGMNIP